MIEVFNLTHEEAKEVKRCIWLIEQNYLLDSKSQEAQQELVKKVLNGVYGREKGSRVYEFLREEFINRKEPQYIKPFSGGGVEFDFFTVNADVEKVVDMFRKGY